MSRGRVLIAAAGFHFALIILICCRDTFVVVIEGPTVLPNQWVQTLQTAAYRVETALGQAVSKCSCTRQSIGLYLNAAGIEAGYGFFAPNIPDTNELLFEIRRKDGSVEYERAGFYRAGVSFRLASLLDLVARVEDENVRQGLIKYLAYAVWREHPDVTSIRATLGTVNFPSPKAFARGEREAYDNTHVYDFTFEVKPKN